LIAAVGGWLALYLTGSVIGLFVALAAGLAVYGVTILAAVKAGVWFSGPAARRAAAS
jgi:hypothetical protein